MLGELDPFEIKRMGGAGNKACNLVLANVDCYIHPSPNLMHWDLCAPESLVKGMGGMTTNLFQERLRYPIDSNYPEVQGLNLHEASANVQFDNKPQGPHPG